MIYALNNVGPRPKNDDSILVGKNALNNVEEYIDEEVTQFGVFDGVGGRKSGQVASKFIAEKFGELQDKDFNEEEFTKYILDSNYELIKLAHSNFDYDGMATTACYVKIFKDRVFVFNMGDSKIYRLRDGILWQMSIDDVPPSDYITHIITACFGREIDTDGLHIYEGNTEEDDIYLLCTDGISDVVNEDEIKLILKQSTIEKQVAKFKEIFKDKQLTDNYSMIIYNNRKE